MSSNSGLNQNLILFFTLYDYVAVSVDTEKRDEGEDVSPLFNNIVNIEL